MLNKSIGLDTINVRSKYGTACEFCFSAGKQNYDISDCYNARNMLQFIENFP